jgi:hypothetical protein
VIVKLALQLQGFLDHTLAGFQEDLLSFMLGIQYQG